MRFTSLIIHILSATLTVASQPVYPIQQHPFQLPNKNPAMSSPTTQPTTSVTAESSTITLSDVLGRSRSINIFAGFTRDFAPISQRFEDAAVNTTILAPVNSAIMALSRKPWEDPEEYERLGTDAYEGGEGEKRAKENLRRFVERHVVPFSPWEEGVRVRTLGTEGEEDGKGKGGDVWWEEKHGKKVIQPGNIEVLSVESTVHNGEIWILKGVMNYARK